MNGGLGGRHVRHDLDRHLLVDCRAVAVGRLELVLGEHHRATPADTRPVDDRGTLRVELDLGVLDRLVRRGQGELREEVAPGLDLGAHPIARIELLRRRPPHLATFELGGPGRRAYGDFTGHHASVVLLDFAAE